MALAESGTKPAALAGNATRKRSRSRRWALLGMLPFFAYISIFLLIPTGELIVGAFRTANGAFTFSNISDIFPRALPAGLRVLPRAVGPECAHGRSARLPGRQRGVAPRNSRFIRPAFVSFLGMAANFAGVPLGFAYIATLGTLGVVTTLLQHLGRTSTQRSASRDCSARAGLPVSSSCPS